MTCCADNIRDVAGIILGAESTQPHTRDGARIHLALAEAIYYLRREADEAEAALAAGDVGEALDALSIYVRPRASP